jgi:superfamily II DNA or RNA helicase
MQVTDRRQGQQMNELPESLFTPLTEREWCVQIEDAIDRRNPEAPALIAKALEAYPSSGDILSIAAMEAVLRGKADQALRYLKRFRKWYEPSPDALATEAIALAQLGRWPLAKALVDQNGLTQYRPTALFCAAGEDMGKRWLRSIARWQPTPDGKPAGKTTRHPLPKLAPKAQPVVVPPSASPAPAPEASGFPALRRFSFPLPVEFRLPSVEVYRELDQPSQSSHEDCLLLNAYAHLALVKGFDDLLCLDHLCGVTSFWYQIETVRKVLKQFRGRVLLADEVGLGKTIEACMILKEYTLRGMAERVLILTPPSLVGQWDEEVRTKFGMAFATSHDALFRDDPAAFWAQPRIIASLASARTPRHFDWVTGQPRDLVIVDEAHHLKDRRSRNWQVVDALQKRFLLLLSATPVQNNLVELYNLLTLLKPGLFKTESDFKASYVTPRQPRSPSNRERLQTLMRDVMIRNTRALVDVKLPPRQALTVRVDPDDAERDSYAALSESIREACRAPTAGHHRMALNHLLQAAGSSPAAAEAALGRMAKGECPGGWTALRDRYAALDGASAKTRALLEILRRNPAEKKMVFARYNATLDQLAAVLTAEGIAHARFDGHLSGPQKDAAIVTFRDAVPVLLCSEAGGEGRNVQFCNTLVNFDLHWNPQAIEQRIGRIHRIGQTREVFVFNLSVRHTLEDRLLAILDEKINMFELVVGEIQAILGEMDEDHDLAELVFSAWIAETETHRDTAFEALETRLLDARDRYKQVKDYDEDLFGEEFTTG